MAIANHASTRTTQLYDRRHEAVILDEIERVVICGIADQASRPGGKKVYLFSDLADLSKIRALCEAKG